MALLVPLVLIAYAVLYAFAFAIPPLHLHSLSNYISGARAQELQQPLQNTFGDWVDKEEKISLERLLANVAPGGRDLEGVVEGSVVASPSKKEPDYFYQCTINYVLSHAHASALDFC
jgi:glucoamylase